jgi:hypothetical protein
MSAKHFEDTKNLKELKDFGGILVPGGFGETGIQGKINVIEYARKNKVPYFGLCYGMQLLVIEYARNVLGLTHANTEEIDSKTKDPRKTRKNCQETYCTEYTNNIIKIGNALGEGQLKIVKKRLDTLEKKKNKTAKEEEDLKTWKNNYTKMVKGIRQKLKDKKEIQKRIKLNMKDCAQKFCNPECKGTIFETRKDLSPELKAEYKKYPAFINVLRIRKKELFKGRKTVLKDGFYYKMKPKTRKASEKKGAISGCIEMAF